MVGLWRYGVEAQGPLRETLRRFRLKQACRIIWAFLFITMGGCDREHTSEQRDQNKIDESVCFPRCDTCVILQCTTYYDEKSVRRIYNHRNDTLVGEDRVYYETGMLRTYSYFDVIGRLMYSRSYSAHGSMIEEHGDIVVQQVISPPEAQVGDTITVRIYIVNPPGVTQYLVGIANKMERYPLFHEEGESGVFVQTFSMAKPGAFRIAYEALMKDSVNGTSQIENNSFVIRFK